VLQQANVALCHVVERQPLSAVCFVKTVENYLKYHFTDNKYLSAVLKCLTLRRLMSYIHGAPILDVSRSHTTTQHSR